MISSASICSVTRMVPISEAIRDPTFPARIRLMTVGENSRMTLCLTVNPTIDMGMSGLLMLYAVWMATTAPMKAEMKATMPSDSNPRLLISSISWCQKILPFWGRLKTFCMRSTYNPMVVNIFGIKCFCKNTKFRRMCV